MEVETDRIEYLANDETVYVKQVTTIWVDVGDVVWEKHKYEAWRRRDGEHLSEALSGFDIPTEVLRAQDPYAVPPDGALVDPEDGPPESDEDDFWEEGPCVYYADEPEEDQMVVDMDIDPPGPLPEELPPAERSDVDDP